MKKLGLLLMLVLMSKSMYAQCDPQSEINENFDTWTSLDPCWKGINNGGMFLVEGDVTFYTFMTPNLSMYLISPEIVSGSYNLKFDFSTVSTNGEEVAGITVQAGLVSSTDSADSFVAISDPLSTTIAPQVMDVNLDLSGESKYFAIKVSAIAPHSAAMIDNLVLSPTMSTFDVVKSQLSIYPNPVQDFLHIDSKLDIQEVKIFGLDGRLILSQKVLSNQKDLNVSHLKSGTYIVQIKTEKEISVHKVLKK